MSDRDIVEFTLEISRLIVMLSPLLIKRLFLVDLDIDIGWELDLPLP